MVGRGRFDLSRKRAGARAFDKTDAPADWTTAAFDDKGWPKAVMHSASAVSPKGGYDEIVWDSAAQLIWSNSLLQDNSLLCRLTVDG